MHSEPHHVPPSRLVPLRGRRSTTLTERIESLHRQLICEVPVVHQIACVLYDPEMDLLKSFVDSSPDGSALRQYEYPLSRSTSLSALKQTKVARIIDDIPTETSGAAAHARYLVEAGFRSSYTVPLFDGELFQGFLFMDSRQPAAFTPPVVNRLEVYVNFVRMMLSQTLAAVRTLVGSARLARQFTYLRDAESGTHLDRMSRYSRIIASGLAVSHGLADEFVEQVFLFSPLHDIGKVGIPDAVLHKPGALTPEERATMATHVGLGIEIVGTMIADFHLESLPGIEVLRNIVAFHHEFLDGSGYPHGIGGDAIPVEARIVTVADIFDALTSRRTYKSPWSFGQALESLQTMADEGKLDVACVAALASQRERAAEIFDRYGDR